MMETVERYQSRPVTKSFDQKKAVTRHVAHRINHIGGGTECLSTAHNLQLPQPRLWPSASASLPAAALAAKQYDSAATDTEIKIVTSCPYRGRRLRPMSREARTDKALLQP